MEGDDVKVLQRALRFAEEDVDGVFGSDVDRAVRTFQKKNSLKIDGKVGPATRSALGIEL
jgi:peptidoglycan hydrolase-like protein with peptidoglycan-binding domain